MIPHGLSLRGRQQIVELAQRENEFLLEAPKLAPAIHEYYLDLSRTRGWKPNYDMAFNDLPPRPGDIVSVRTREYLVNDVVPAAAGDMTLVRLSCLNDDAQGMPLEVLWEAEVDARPAASDRTKPIASPSATTFMLPSSTMRTTAWRPAPSAIRMPISRVRRLTAYATTP